MDNSGRWPGGMNNVNDIHELGATRETPAYLRDALNVDIDRNGKALRRNGYKLIFGGNAHSLFGHESLDFGLVVFNGDLCWFDTTGAPPNPLLPVDPAARMSYARHAGRTYWSNGAIRGYVNDDKTIYPWGIDTPPTQPTLSVLPSGGLDEGDYQIAITHLRGLDGHSGEESGAMIAGTIFVPAGGGIQLSAIPQPNDPNCALVNVYMTPANGDVFYKAVSLVVGLTEYSLGVTTPGRQLQTHMLDRMPAGTIVRSYRGRIYSAFGNRLTYSDPLRYGLTSRTHNYIDFAEPILLVEPVEDGIYVGTTQQTLFLTGSDPKNFELREVEPHGVVPYSSCEARGADFKLEYKGKVACWWNAIGNLVVGSVSGQLVHLTKNNLSLPRYTTGASMFRDVNGSKHVVSSMRKPQNEGFGAADYAVVKVIRNGVVIQ